MSRVAKNPIKVPTGVTVSVASDMISIKGAKGELNHKIHSRVQVSYDNQVIKVAPLDDSMNANAQAGTTRALINNIVIGVTTGFERKLELVGVGYRAQIQGAKLNLSLGYSHPVVYQVPKGIAIETPSQTEIIIKGMSKHLVGQVAAIIRSYRAPECYKGKGIRYAGEVIKLKETKKK